MYIFGRAMDYEIQIRQNRKYQKKSRRNKEIRQMFRNARRCSLWERMEMCSLFWEGQIECCFRKMAGTQEAKEMIAACPKIRELLSGSLYHQ